MFNGNKIYSIDENGNKKRIFWVKGLRIRFKGENSVILLHEPLKKFRKSYIRCGNNCVIEIGSSHYKKKKLCILANGDNSVCRIGKDFHCTNSCTILLHEEPNLSVEIGDDCMFGTNVFLRTSDAHIIYDINTNKTTNFGASIKIGNHCWLARNTTILKGVNLADNCIIATNATVTKDCSLSNTIYAGIPAQPVKFGVNWKRERPLK